jgi:multidrug resistance efflux pump
MSVWLKDLRRFKHIIILSLVVMIFYAVYFFYYYQPITNNAFVVANFRPIAAQVSGYIDKLYVKNGQKVKANQPLFSVDDTIYRLKKTQYEYALKSAKVKISSLKKVIENQKLQVEIQQNKTDLLKIKFSNEKQLTKTNATPEFTLLTSKYAYLEQLGLLKIAKNKISAAELKLQDQREMVHQIQAQLAQAEYDLKHTVVYAKSDGVISNLFLSIGSPVVALKPLFSFIDTSEYWVQANFKETDLSGAKVGQKAKIELRMYGDSKILEGRMVSVNWAVDRQLTNSSSQLQIVKNENQWTLMPQRFPVLIKIINNTPNTILPVGASAYVTLER